MEVLSSIIASQHGLHAEYAGVVPEIASRAHVEAVLPVVRESLAQAGVGLGMIDAVSVGNQPGLIGSLLVGVAAAKSLAWSLGKPVVGVDHVMAHLYSGMLEHGEASDACQPITGHPPGGEGGVLPALGLVVSGGHTAMYDVQAWTRVTRIGATIDDAAGEAFDKAATILGLPYPGGPNLDRLAREAGANDRAVEFPVSRLSPESLDFSFSGLKTSLLYAVRGVPSRPRAGVPAPPPPPALTHERARDLAASFQRAVCAAIILKLRRAHARAGERGEAYRSLVVGGGVIANSRLRRELREFALSAGLDLRVPRPEYCMDNAAMIGGLACHVLRERGASGWALQALPTTAC